MAMKPTIERPTGHDDSVFVASVSGGKDSTATVLAMIEAGIPFRAVFADTGWEAQETYDYLDMLRHRLSITIDRVGVEGGFRAQAIKEGILPHGKTAWCTRELKIKPIKAYHERIAVECATDTVSVVGIRREESAKRAAILREFTYSDEWRGYVWMPLLAWKVEEVLAIHHRHGIPVNPLYKDGFSRVGCRPCRNARKGEIRLWADTHPEVIDDVRALEKAVTEERHRRGHSGNATFFHLDQGGAVGIDEVVAWSRTSRGGRQLPLIQEGPDGGCFRWGMCEPPTRDDEGE